MRLTYTDKNWDDKNIDVEIATLEELSDAYTFLLERGCTHDYPGSAGWANSKVHRDHLAAMLVLRPEVEQYRADQAKAKRTSRLAGKDILGM